MLGFLDFVKPLHIYLALEPGGVYNCCILIQNDGGYAMARKKKAEAIQTEEIAEVKQVAEPTEKKRGGRKPMTEAEKEAMAKQRAEIKAKAESMVPSLTLQYQGADTDLAGLVEAAKADFKAKKKRTPITELKLYIKPEDGAAYYVINGAFDGKVPL